MSRARSVTVFVKRAGQHYRASTYSVDAMHPSAAHAAQRAGARHLNIPETRVELVRENEHVFIARERAPAPPVAWSFLGLGLVLSALSVGFILACVWVAERWLR